MERIVGSIVSDGQARPFVLDLGSGRFEVGRFAEPDPEQTTLSVIQQQRFVQLISERASVSFAHVRLGQYRCPSCGTWIEDLAADWGDGVCRTCEERAERLSAARARPPEPETAKPPPVPEAPPVPEESPALAPSEDVPTEDAPAENRPGEDAPPVPAAPVAAPRSDYVEGGLLERALAIALDAHHGQTDRAGRPYVFHPLRLMHRQHTDAARMAALLHDVVEDSGWTLEQLRDEGFPDAVVEAIDALTHREDEGESYADYVARAAQNPLARQIKRADLEDNMDIRRLGRPLDEHDLARLERYRKAWQELGAGD